MIIYGKKIILKPACESDRKEIYNWLTKSDLTSSGLKQVNGEQ